MQIKKSLSGTPLPDISFIGGMSGDFSFLFRNPDGSAFDGSSYDASFAMRQRRQTALDFNASAVFCEDDNGVLSRLRIRFSPSETAELDGEFIYQITLSSTETGEICEPLQGRMTIIPNVKSKKIGGRS